MPNIRTLLPPAQEDQRLRVAAYCRVSSESDEQQHSFAAQVRYYTELVKQNPDWELADIYADEGVSGTGTERREEFQRLVADCKRGKIQRILTKSVSRFARNTVDCLNTVRLLSSLGVTILFEKEELDTGKMSGEILLAMMSTQAQNESTSISQNMRWSYEKRMKSGKFITCHAPYGYRIRNGELEIHKEEASTVRKIYGWYTSGIGKQEIVNRLNSDKTARPCYNSMWSTFTIDYILKNERYIGDALLQKKYTTDMIPYRRLYNHGERTAYYVEQSHPPIISREVFQAAEQLRMRRTYHTKKEIHTLTHLLYCTDCGHTYRRVLIQDVACWKCVYRNDGLTQCHTYRVDEEDVLAALRRMIFILHDNHAAILRPMLVSLEQVQAKANGTGTKLYELDCEIAALSRKIHNISKLQAAGILDPADFAAQTGTVNAKITTLRRKRCELLRQAQDGDGLARLREVCETLENLEPGQETDEPLLRSIVEKIIVRSHTELEIHIFGGLVLTEHLPDKKRRCQRV